MVRAPLMLSAWKKVRKNIFRLESLPKYNVPEDLVLFKKWKKGKLNVNFDFKDWFKNLEKIKKKGIKIQRVRILPLPLSNYTKYEIDVWKHSIKYGEKIYFIKSKNYQKIKKSLHFKPKDFWAFDDKIVVIFYYNKKGNFIKEELISKAKINNYKSLKRKLLQNSIPMKHFLKLKI